MKWQYKAKIMKLWASLPGGGKIYRSLQKCFGRLRPDPWTALRFQAEMARWVDSVGMSIAGKVFLRLEQGINP